MKIVHVIIACFYKEGYGYQENLLPAKHKEIGYEVSIITHIKRGYEYKEYVNEKGVKVTILPDEKGLLKKIPIICIFTAQTKGLYKAIENEAPDIIFVHGLQAVDNLTVVKYKKKNPKVRVFADQHGDYYNMPIKTAKDRILQKVFYRYIAKRIESCSEKVWGVTPWRVKYLRDVYSLSKEKTDLLVMGGDETIIDWDNHIEIKRKIREQYSIPNDKFLVITGGKIDKAKNFHILCEVIEQLPDNILLLFFGRFEVEMKDYINSIDNHRIINAGWVNSDESYSLFEAADLGVFLGTHSVLWEQACASGLPCVFKDWDGGFDHIDVGGNCVLLNNISVQSVKSVILELSFRGSNYQKMKNIAESIARPYFSYLEIAKRSILS